jgi:hypothetical protein
LVVEGAVIVAGNCRQIVRPRHRQVGADCDRITLNYFRVVASEAIAISSPNCSIARDCFPAFAGTARCAPRNVTS